MTERRKPSTSVARAVAFECSDNGAGRLSDAAKEGLALGCGVCAGVLEHRTSTGFSGNVLGGEDLTSAGGPSDAQTAQPLAGTGSEAPNHKGPPAHSR